VAGVAVSPSFPSFFYSLDYQFKDYRQNSILWGKEYLFAKSRFVLRSYQDILPMIFCFQSRRNTVSKLRKKGILLCKERKRKKAKLVIYAAL